MHPDKNMGRDTTGLFQELNNAYDIMLKVSADVKKPVSKAAEPVFEDGDKKLSGDDIDDDDESDIGLSEYVKPAECDDSESDNDSLVGMVDTALEELKLGTIYDEPDFNKMTTNEWIVHTWDGPDLLSYFFKSEIYNNIYNKIGKLIEKGHPIIDVELLYFLKPVSGLVIKKYGCVKLFEGIDKIVCDITGGRFQYIRQFGNERNLPFRKYLSARDAKDVHCVSEDILSKAMEELKQMSVNADAVDVDADADVDVLDVDVDV